MGVDGFPGGLGRRNNLDYPMPTVSVIIPAYNQAHFLSDTLRSVLDGTYQDLEIIIVDDGSTDNTRQVAESISDPRIRYIFQENSGLSSARNTGIRNASGSLLTYLDSDDLFLPEKLSLLTDILEREPEIGLVAGQAIIIDENNQPLGEVFTEPIPKDITNLLFGNPLHVGSVLLRSEWQDKVGFFDQNLRSYEDWDMWLRLARAGCQMGWVAKPVSLYRFHRNQMTRDDQQMTAATFAVLEKTYQDPNLPASWRMMHDKAYSFANLRGAAQAYSAKNFEIAKKYLVEAVRMNPELSANQAELLAKNIAGWANYSKTSEPLPFLEDIYANLPESLKELRQRKSQDLAEVAMQVAFTAYSRGDLHNTRNALAYAFRQQPKWLLNRGAISLYLQSWFLKTTEKNY